MLSRADRHDAHGQTAIGDDCRPADSNDFAHDEEPRFVLCARRDLEEVWIVLDRLRLVEIDSVFLPVRCAFTLVELKREHGIKTVPICLSGQTARWRWLSPKPRGGSAGEWFDLW
jgi:hypothetical protein